jgi:hypothetical protein
MNKTLTLIILSIIFSSCKNDKNTQNKNIDQKKDSISEIKLKDTKADLEGIIYNEYCNERYDFCMEYPKDFIPQGESYNGDGQVFISKDKKVQISTFGSMSIIDVNPTIKDHFEMASKDEKITSKVLKKDFFIISGYDKNGNIFYQKTLSKNFEDIKEYKSPDYYQTLMIIYPKNQSDEYSEYCKKIANFF